jgi:hypothetical protein
MSEGLSEMHDYEADQHLAHRAGEVLGDERAVPGSQPPEDVAWAADHARGIAERLADSQQRLRDKAAAEEGHTGAGDEDKKDTNGDNDGNNN